MNAFCECNFFGWFHSSIRSDIFYKIDLLKRFWKTYRKHPRQSFLFLNKVAHHQTCTFFKKRLQYRYLTLNFAKLLKALCRTPSVSAFDFNSTLLTLRPRKTYIYVFSVLLFLYIFKPRYVLYRT